MNMLYRIFISSFMCCFIYSCNNGDIISTLSDAQEIDITNPEIEINIVSKDLFNGSIQILLDDHILFSDSINIPKSDIPLKYIFPINLDPVADSILRFPFKLRKKRNILVNLVIRDTLGDVIHTDLHECSIYSPPYSVITNVNGRNILATPIRGDDVLKDFIAMKSKYLEYPVSLNELSLFEKGDTIKVVVEVDSLSKQSFIMRYPISSNRLNGNNYIEDEIINTIFQDTNIMNIVLRNNTFNFEDNVIQYEKVLKNEKGEIGLFLINLDDSLRYSIQHIGTFLVDGVKPKFSNSGYCNFNGNPRIQGLVCIINKEFWGVKPYNVPFAGTVFGDVSKVIVNNVEVKFEIGQEFFFRRSMNLSDGYNRVPVTVFDHSGNKTESFIEITMEFID